MIISITGLPGSGKTILADMLKKRGFKMFEMSSIIKNMMTEKGIELTMRNIERYSTELRRRRGSGVYAVETVKRLGKNTKGNIIISGLRSPAEIVYFRKRFKNFIIIAVTAPDKVRYKRLTERKEHKIGTYKDFKFRDAKMKEFGMLKVIEHADYVIANTSSFGKLDKELDDILADVKKRGQ